MVGCAARALMKDAAGHAAPSIALGPKPVPRMVRTVVPAVLHPDSTSEAGLIVASANEMRFEGLSESTAKTSDTTFPDDRRRTSALPPPHAGVDSTTVLESQLFT